MKKVLALLGLILLLPCVVEAVEVVRPAMIAADPAVSGAVAPVNSVSGLATELRNTTQTSYSASTGSITMGGAGGPATICAIYGSATKTVKVTRVSVSGTQTTAGQVAYRLSRHSTINTGVVHSTMTSLPLDSNNAAGTGYAVVYTTNPTQGTLTGIVRMGQILFAAPATIAVAGYTELYGYPDQPITLRGVAQHLDVSLPGTAMPGGVMHCNFTWTEE